MKCIVYVLAPNRHPLMPCSCAVARLLLKEHKATVVHRTPFTIKLLTEPATTYIQSLTLGIDTGSSVIGSAVANEQGEILYLSETAVRNDISEIMPERAQYRRNRRNRQTRYRPARWSNRRNSIKTGRFSPTMRSKLDAHLREMRFVQSLLPITSIVLETGTFDPHALKNPAVLEDKILYQRGLNYGYANTKAYVLARDNYTCQHCGGRSKDPRLHVHHLVFRSQHGSNEEENLLTLCKPCHDGVHAGSVILKQAGKKKGTLKYATQMNSICIQLRQRVPSAEETFGFITKEQRQAVGLPKAHVFDATIIATRGQAPTFSTTATLTKRCVPDGDYQQTRGRHSEQHIPTGKLGGFRKFDKVRYRGEDYFIKGRMATGYAILMDIVGTTVDLKPMPKFETMHRVSARASWITRQHPMPSI